MAEQERLDRNERKISFFMAKELLYDFIEGRLDADRARAVEKYLEANPAVKNDIEIMRQAEAYVKKLSQTKISEVHLDELNSIRPYSEVVLRKMQWQNWPDLLRWATEAMAISIVVAIIALFVPWRDLNIRFPDRKSDVELAKIDQPKLLSEESLFRPSVALKKLLKVEPAPVAETKNTNANAKDNLSANSAAPLTDGKTSATEKINEKVIPLKGTLFRMMMTIPDYDPTTDAVRKKIIELGGKKAGEVELGWRKDNPDGLYYHFSIPEKNYQQFVSNLGGYGQVRIYKSPHERIMPEGQMRVILWIEGIKKLKTMPPVTAPMAAAPAQAPAKTQPKPTPKPIEATKPQVESGPPTVPAPVPPAELSAEPPPAVSSDQSDEFNQPTEIDVEKKDEEKN
jgi:hypothetical protein